MFNGAGTETQLELFASDAPVVPSGERVVQVVLDRVQWQRPRDFGEVFLARHLWRLLGLDELLKENWTKVREGIEVKRVASPDGSEDTFILCRATHRRKKEATIRDRFEQRMDERLARL